MSKCCMNCFPSCFGFPLLHILPDGWVSFREEFSSIAYHLLLMANGPTAPCHLQEPRKGGKWQMSQAGQSLEEGAERGTRRGRLGLCDVEGQPITAGRGDRKKGERERARKEGGREIKRGRADHMLTLRKNCVCKCFGVCSCWRGSWQMWNTCGSALYRGGEDSGGWGALRSCWKRRG